MKGKRGTMKKTRLSAVASLLSAGVLMGGCMADFGGESEGEEVAAQGPSVVEGDALGEAQQAISNGLRFNAFSEPAGQPPRADLQVWRSSDSTWYAQRTSDGQGTPWTLSRPVQPQDVPVSMNIDGDALADQVTWRPSNGIWHYRLSSTNLQYQVSWGIPGDIPTPGDFNGDGKTDFAIWRPSSGTFHIKYSSGGTYAKQWGTAGDIPVVGDYDGDKKDDLAVYRPSNGIWYYIRSSNGAGVANPWGVPGDIPVTGDFDKDGKTDFTIFRPSDGYWWTLKSSGSPTIPTQWGARCDVPVPADYDGDGKTDIGVRRMENATNYFINSSTGVPVATVYGLTTDVPANASTFCYINGALGPCRASICGPVGGIRRTAQVAGGMYHSVTVKSDGTVWASGSNSMGMLGDGTRTYKLTPVKVKELTKDLTDVVAVTAGEYHTLALKSDGTVWAWGQNYQGQLGYVTPPDSTFPYPISTKAKRVEGLTNVVAVEAGDDYSLALKSDGTLWAWGGNSEGQLGTGTISPGILSPTQVLTNVVSVSGGRFHTLAVKSDGTVWSWGRSVYGQLGYQWSGSNPTPKQVPNLTGVVQVSAGAEHSVALKRDGTMWAWGWNRDGQLGDGTLVSRETPMPVTGITDVVAMDAGYFPFNLALKGDGTLWSIGYNLPVKMLDGVMALDAGYSLGMAVKSDGTLWKWGENWYGEMGDGTWQNVRHTPGKLMESVKL